MLFDENQVVAQILHLKPGHLLEPESMLAWLGHENYRVRKAMLQILPVLRVDHRGIQGLIDGLADANNSGLRNSCAEALVMMGSLAVPALAQAMLLDDVDQRKFVIECLGRIPGESAEKVLLRHTEQHDSNLRAALFEALAKHASQRSGEVLLQQFHHLQTLDLQVQAAVLDALARCQLVVPYEALAPLCRIRPLLRFIYPLLGRCQDSAALHTLLDGLEQGALGTKKAALVGLLSYMEQHMGSEQQIHQLLQQRQAKPTLLVLLRMDEEAVACAALRLMGHAYFADLAYELVAIGVKWGRQADVYRMMQAIGTDVVPTLLQAFAQAGPTSQLTMLDIFAKFHVLQHILPQLESSLSPALRSYANEQIQVAEAIPTTHPRPGQLAKESQPLSPSSAPPRQPTAPILEQGWEGKFDPSHPHRPSALAPGHLDEQQLTIDLYEQLKQWVQRFSGIQLPADGLRLISRRLRPRLLLHGMADFPTYFQALGESRFAEQELTQLMDVLTTNETYFFREMRGFEAFFQVFVPHWCSQHGPQDSLHVWSAGCASGEEPYTLRMLLEEQNLAVKPTLSIVATDISMRMLQAAKEGVYRGMALRETHPARLARFFQPVGQAYQIKASIKEQVRFAYYNLLASPSQHMGWFDAIFCRNVLIYFSRETRLQVLELFYRHLHPGGVLFLGHAESLLNVQTGFEPVCMRGEFVYRKPMRAEQRKS